MAKQPTLVTLNLIVKSNALVLYKTFRSLAACIDATMNNGPTLQINIAYKEGEQEINRIVGQFVASQKQSVNIARHPISDDKKANTVHKLAEASTGEYVMFCSDSGLFTRNFLVELQSLAKGDKKPSAYIMAYTINFDGTHNLTCNIDTDDKNFSIESVYDGTFYEGDIAIPQSVLKTILSKQSIVAEAWSTSWLMGELVAAKCAIRTVPGTIYFKRHEKPEITTARDLLNTKKMAASRLYEPAIFNKVGLPIPSHSSATESTVSAVPGRSVMSNLKARARARPLLFNYAKTQYHLHKNLSGALLQKVRPNVVTTANLYEDLTTIQSPVPERLQAVGIDDSTVELWGEINQYEPMVRASWDMLVYIPIVNSRPESPAAQLYWRLCHDYGDKSIKDVVLVPHLVHGGADLAAIHLISELSRHGVVLVITTIDTESPWLSKLSSLKNVICLESKIDFARMDQPARLDLIVKIIRYWGVKRLSIINSEVGYQIAELYGDFLKRCGCKTFLHTYAFDMTEDGYIFNVIPNGLVRAYAGVDKYVTDSLGYKYELEKINGFEPEKILPLYLPIVTNIKSKTDYNLRRKVLWASRIHTSKLIEVAVEVGRQLATKGIELHMFGVIDETYARNDKFKLMIKDTPSIVYHGAYDGFGSLNADAYDMFLMTSRNEGMPNVILEAAMANIYIIAPAVGGIPESISNGINGTLVNDKFDPSAYVVAISDAYNKKLFSSEPAIRDYNSRLLARHSLEKYQQNVLRLMSLG